MLVKERDDLRKKLVSERKELADARGSDHEPMVNAGLLDVAERIGKLEGNITAIDDIIASAKVVEPCEKCGQIVSLGSKVLIQISSPQGSEEIIACIDGVIGTHDDVPILTPNAPVIQRIMGFEAKQETKFVSRRGETITIEVLGVESAYDC